MGRARLIGYPPPPKDCDDANASFMSDKYSGKDFSRFYRGLVCGTKEGERALIFASDTNLAKLGEHTKTIMADGTFHTAPKIVKGKLYQILIVYAEYKNHVFPIMKAIMTNKTRSLYDSVFSKLKTMLPEEVKPTVVITDYEPALQGGLAAIFPDAKICGCWFHYSQVSYFLLITSYQLR